MMKKEYFELILEDINGKFGLLAEGQAGFNIKFGNLDTKIESLDNKIDGIRFELKRDISALSSQLNYVYRKLDDRINITMNRIENHEVRIIKLEQ